MGAVPVVAIKSDKSPIGYVIINEADFVPSRHDLFTTVVNPSDSLLVATAKVAQAQTAARKARQAEDNSGVNTTQPRGGTRRRTAHHGEEAVAPRTRGGKRKGAGRKRKQAVGSDSERDDQQPVRRRRAAAEHQPVGLGTADGSSGDDREEVSVAGRSGEGRSEVGGEGRVVTSQVRTEG